MNIRAIRDKAGPDAVRRAMQIICRATEILVQEQFQFVGIAPVFAGSGGNLVGVHRFDKLRRDEHDQFRLLALIAHRAEERAEHRDITKQRRHVLLRGDVVVEQAGDREGLAFIQLDDRFDLAAGEAGNDETVESHGSRKIQIADFRRDLQADACRRPGRSGSF